MDALDREALKSNWQGEDALDREALNWKEEEEIPSWVYGIVGRGKPSWSIHPNSTCNSCYRQDCPKKYYVGECSFKETK